MDLANIVSSPQNVLHHPSRSNAASNESAVQNAEQQHLFNAIDSATPERLRAVLQKVSTQVPGAFPMVASELLLVRGTLKRAAPWKLDGIRAEDESEDSADEKDDEEDEGYTQESDYSEEEAGTKSMRRQRFEICVQCGVEYDVLQNGKKSCRWHDGETEVDWDGDFWADHDEDCHGTIDTESMRETYPEGFIWTCCDAGGDTKGCKRSRHRPNRAKRARRM